MYQLRIYETVSQRPRGDRDMFRHDSSSFEVVLVTKFDRASLATFDQYDFFHSTIRGNRLEYLKKALDYANSVASVFGAAEIIGPELTRKEKEIMDTEAEIRRLNQKLQDLKRMSL